MARGIAKLLGFELMVNFDLPYFSRTPSEFWRRWHISLSSWLRDYLYVPLGGNRGTAFATYRNLFLTMLLGGLWHGAAWTFIAWGAFHGAILAAYRALSVDRLLERLKPATPDGALVHLGAWLVMSALTLVGWALFRAESLTDAQFAIAAIFNFAAASDMAALPEASTVSGLVLPLAIANVANRFFPRAVKGLADEARNAGLAPAFARANAFLLLFACVVFLAAEGQQDFIYFDF